MYRLMIVGRGNTRNKYRDRNFWQKIRLSKKSLQLLSVLNWTIKFHTFPFSFSFKNRELSRFLTSTAMVERMRARISHPARPLIVEYCRPPPPLPPRPLSNAPYQPTPFFPLVINIPHWRHACILPSSSACLEFFRPFFALGPQSA